MSVAIIAPPMIAPAMLETAMIRRPNRPSGKSGSSARRSTQTNAEIAMADMPSIGPTQAR